MAIEWINWAFEQQVTSGEKLVLLVLANRADKKGVSWPSQKDIAHKTNQSRQAVNKQIQSLCKKGLLTKFGRYREDGYKTSSQYCLRNNKRHKDVKKNDMVCHPKRHKDVNQGDNNISPNGDIEPSGESSIETEDSILKPSCLKTPSWLNRTLWKSYLHHRKAMGSNTEIYIQKILIQKLKDFYSRGQDPTAVIQQSISNGWANLYPAVENIPLSKEHKGYLTNGCDSVGQKVRQSNKIDFQTERLKRLLRQGASFSTIG